MKWFTDAVYSTVGQDGNEPPDDAFEQAARANREHLDSIDHRLSPEVRALANVYMHDAIPKSVRSKFPKSLALERHPSPARFHELLDEPEWVLSETKGESSDKPLARRSPQGRDRLTRWR